MTLVILLRYLLLWLINFYNMAYNSYKEIKNQDINTHNVVTDLRFINNKYKDEYAKKGLLNKHGFKLLNKKHINLRIEMTNLARSTAPVDTGNLKNNGIYSMLTPKGFRIVWDKRYAHYIEYVDKGQNKYQTPKIKKNKGFVDRGIAMALIPIHKILNKEPTRIRGNGRSDLHKALPLFYKSDNRMYKRMMKSIDKHEEFSPNWDDNFQETDISEYDYS